MTKTKGLQNLSAGWMSWRWLAGTSAKEKQWLVGVMRSRGGYESWTAHLTAGLRDAQFLTKFETTTDPWQRSRLVGERISELRKSFRGLTVQQREELAKLGETELRTGLELLGKDKRTIQELIELVDPPTAQ
jgi:hypothetical protein